MDTLTTSTIALSIWLLLVQASAHALAAVLMEGQPPVECPVIVRQWYSEFHPDFGPLHIPTVEDLEQRMGDVLRRDVPGVGYKALRTAFGKRRKVAEVSQKVCQKWAELYAGHVPKVCGAPCAGSSFRYSYGAHWSRGSGTGTLYYHVTCRDIIKSIIRGE